MIYPLSNRIPESRTSSKAPQKRPISGTFGWHLKRGVWKKHWTSIKLQHGVNICKYAVPETRYIKIHISKLQKSNISTSQKSKNVSQNPNLHFRTIRSWSSHHAPSHSCTEPEDVRWNAPSKCKHWLRTIQNLALNHPKRWFEQSLNHPKISKNWVSTIATRVFTIIKYHKMGL